MMISVLKLHEKDIPCDRICSYGGSSFKQAHIQRIILCKVDKMGMNVGIVVSDGAEDYTFAWWTKRVNSGKVPHYSQ